MPALRPADLRRALGVLTALVALSLSPRGEAQDVWTDPYPGVVHLSRATAAPNRMHVVLVDIGRADVRMRATRSADRALRTSAFAQRYGCAIAINGDFFSFTGYPTIGLAIGAGEQWPGSRDGAIEGFLAAGRDNAVRISPPPEVIDPPPAWMSEVVSGRPLIVDQGAALPTIDCGPHFCARHPRTGVGVSADGQTLILATIDGRSTASIGATTFELGLLMAEAGAWQAINLDGGGSTTMYIETEGGVVNAPSDGIERVVANHLGVALVQPFGDLTGQVYDAETAVPLAGATVFLPSGDTTSTDAGGAFSFDGLPRGAVTVGARASGYVPSTEDVFVAAADTSFVVLFLGRE